MRVIHYAKWLLLGLSLTLFADDPVFAQSHVLTGKMAWWQQIVGSLVCQVRVEPTNGQQGQKGFVIVETSVAPGNVFHWHASGPGIEGDQYDGYSTADKVWWETQADSSGYAGIFRSAGGSQYDQVSAPRLGRISDTYREVYNIGRDGTFHEEVTRRVGNSWREYNRVLCKKVRSPGSILRTVYAIR